MADENYQIPGDPPQPWPSPAFRAEGASFPTALPTVPTLNGPPPRPIAPAEPKDGTREIIETIVFVVVLVLLLKTFLAEAFVIPTGSMATTLLGYHLDVECEHCQYRFKVNASSEVERKPPDIVTGCVCPNCRLFNDLRGRLGGGKQP